tara:strand:- start:286 stop:567 length:282 start_codon:yes stop_codon:yes gene_type:complete
MVVYNKPDTLAAEYPFGILKLRDGVEMPASNVLQINDLLKRNTESIIKNGDTRDVQESFQLIKSDYNFRKVKIGMSIVFLLVIFLAYIFRKIK